MKSFIDARLKEETTLLHICETLDVAREAESPAQDQPWLGDAERTLAEARIAERMFRQNLLARGLVTDKAQIKNAQLCLDASLDAKRRGDACKALDKFVSPGMLAALRGTLRSSSAQAASLTGAAALATLNKSQIDVALAELGSVGDASVIVLIALSERLEESSDDLADSLGQLGPLLRPLVKLLGAELLANSLNYAMEHLEDETLLSSAALAAAACDRYAESPPHSAVASRVLRRAILRYQPEYWSAVGFEASCRELAEANADVSCKKLWETVYDAERAEEFGDWQEVPDQMNPPSAKILTDPDAAIAAKLQSSAEACSAEADCTLSRAARVAGALLLTREEASEHFSKLEGRLQSLESGLGSVQRAVSEGFHTNDGRIQTLTSTIKGIETGVAGLGEEARHSKELLDELRKARESLEEARLELIKLRSENDKRCSKHVQEVFASREAFMAALRSSGAPATCKLGGREPRLDFSFPTASAPAPGSPTSTSAPAAHPVKVTANLFEMCFDDTPTIFVRIEFDRCDFAVGGLSPLRDALANAGVRQATIVGYSDKLDPSRECVARVSDASVRKNETLAFEPGSTRSRTQMNLSLKRAQAVRDGLGCGPSQPASTTPPELACSVFAKGEDAEAGRAIAIELQMPDTIKRFDPVQCGLAAVMDPTP